jgi:uncharacterized protein (TIGR02271 family)
MTTGNWTVADLRGMEGAPVYSSEGDKVGAIQDIWMDDSTGTPAWIGLGTGIFRTKHVLVPVTNARRYEDGLTVPFTKDEVKNAPDIDESRITPEMERTLYDYYGLGYGKTGRPEARTSTDAAMTRSEEELAVAKERQPKERVRLRKYVVTEPVQQTVPVRREEVRVEREPITEENIDEAMSGPDIAEGEHEEVLMEERVVPEKRVVPKERVRLEKDTATDEETVNEEVRKERIDVEREGSRRRK